ncbi:MAG: hypothetical protein WAL52_12295 [Candidatus Sulfotelmatobacter sp.]
MMKYKVICWFVIAAASTCLATAQSADPLKNATKPLTEKSATPAPHKSSVALPPARTTNTNAELNRLERQKIVLSDNPKSAAPSARKNASSMKPAETSADSSAPIDYKYQKPAGGRQADTPNAHTPNSSTPRVTKKN